MQTLELTLRLNPATEASLRMTAHLDGVSVADLLQSALDRELRHREMKRAALNRNRQAARFDVVGPQASSALA